MSSGLSETGQTTALVLVGLMLLVIPAGLTIAQGLSTPTAEQSTIPTVTLPSLTSPTPTATASPTLTPTSTPTPDGDDNNTDGNSTTGQTHFVNAGVGPADSVTSEEGCSGANYSTIQAAVDAAESGETVVVCPGTYSEHVEVTTSNLTLTSSDRVTQAGGDVTITSANGSAVWINASGVTLQGFNISVGEGADYAIEVGGEKAVIKNNTVDSPGVGIFLSDGHTETGECRVENRTGTWGDDCDKAGPPVDANLGDAMQGRVLNNTVSAKNIRIWVDADQTVLQNNLVTDQINPKNQPDYAECRANQNQAFRPCQKRFNDSIVSSGNNTLIRGNTIQTDRKPTGLFVVAAGIQIGKTPTQGHNMATNNTVIGNSVDKPLARGIQTRNVTAGALILDNTVTSTYDGIKVQDEAIIRNNHISDVPDNCGGGGVTIDRFRGVTGRESKEVLVINNTIDGGNSCLVGVAAYHDVEIIGNTIKNFRFEGVRFGICRGGRGHAVDNQITNIGLRGVRFTEVYRDRDICHPDAFNHRVEIINNKIRNGGRFGIFIENNTNPSRYEIHGNLINNNQELGIYNLNESIIVDATNNIWDCGGPSSGFDPLADPYTGRLANGSGDAISAGNSSTRNGHPISNVHFDPFRELSSCPVQTSTPSPTATPTSTPSPTPTQPPDGRGNGNGPGGGAGSGDGGGAGSGDGIGKGEGGGEDTDASSGSDDSGGGDGDTATPPPTATPSSNPTGTPTPTPTDTPTPTPVVEPGFGVATWLVGFIFAVSLFALRRRGDQ